MKAWRSASLVKVMFPTNIQQLFSEATSPEVYMLLYIQAHFLPCPVVAMVILKSTNKASIYQDNSNNNPKNH